MLLLAELLLQLGWVLRYLTDGADAIAAFESALAAISVRPAGFDHMRGRLYFGLSGVYSDAGEHTRCAEIRNRAVKAYEQALAHADDPPMRWISDSSSGMSSLAATLRKVGRLQEALDLARRSVVVAKQALALDPEDLRAALNLQYAHFVTSQVLMELDGNNCPEALDNAELGLAAARAAHRLREQDIITFSQPLLQVARARIGCGSTEALPLVEEAIANATRLAEFRPGLRRGHLALALAWRVRLDLAETQREWMHCRDAARESFHAALDLAPGYMPGRDMLAELDALVMPVTF